MCVWVFVCVGLWVSVWVSVGMSVFFSSKNKSLKMMFLLGFMVFYEKLS